MKKKTIQSLNVSALLLCILLNASGQSKDWLLGNFQEKSNLEKTNNDQLILTNGLISRTFSMVPNGATIGFDNLINGESVIRSVRPEAIVEIDGIEYEVGGLEGQPAHNYLKKSWIKDMTANPGSFKYSSYSINEIEERFQWKKRMEWMPRDMPWPPKGKTLTMVYKGDDATINTLLGEMDSDMNREPLMEDKFTVLSRHWEIFASGASDRSSFINEGKAGEIMAMSNTAVYAEQLLPPNSRIIKCKLNNGTDISGSHGLGMVVVFPEKLVRLAFSGTYGITFSDGEQQINSRRDSYTPYYLRMEIKGNELIAFISTDNLEWKEVGKAGTGGKQPLKVRLGKTDMDGAGTDSKNKGDRSRCLVEYFSVLGDLINQSRSDAAKRYDYLKDIEVHVHYSIYDGIPLISKWI
ncbi:MAG: hypothetical protein KAI95_20730, partial [Bacteroidales bacterium]|nr:hypothetical protein [Bacteroidales bacterium]